jgi:opacity protein-like surface antigen
MLQRTIGLAALGLLLCTGSAYGQADYARNGPYLGLAGTFAAENFSDVGGLDFDESLGINTRLGYRLHPNFSAELQGEWLDGFDAQFGMELEAWAITANGKAHLLTGQIQPFVLVGLGVMHADLTIPGFLSAGDEDFAARFGGGIEFYLTENIVAALDATYVLPAGDLKDLDYVSFGWGLQYRF